MSKKTKVLVLGYFGYMTNQLDGQTVKTRDVYRLAKEQLNDCTVLSCYVHFVAVV